MRQKALSRDERKQQIIATFHVKLMNGETGEMTTADIARMLHLSPSTKLRDMIYELVIEGTLLDRTEPMPGVAKYRRIFYPNPKHFKGAERINASHTRRAIKVNTKQGLFWEEL